MQKSHEDRPDLQAHDVSSTAQVSEPDDTLSAHSVARDGWLSSTVSGLGARLPCQAHAGSQHCGTQQPKLVAQLPRRGLLRGADDIDHCGPRTVKLVK